MISADSGVHEMAVEMTPEAMSVSTVQEMFSIHAVLADLEGTTTSGAFYEGVLVPYAKGFFRSLETGYRDLTHPILRALAPIFHFEAPAEHSIVDALLPLIQTPAMEPGPIQDLQHAIWQNGYQSGDIQANVYEDACLLLDTWSSFGIPLYTFSSLSVRTQIDMFSHTTVGDLSKLFDQYFDSTVGGETESQTYRTIAQRVGFHPQTILFLSDSIAKLDAAKQAGMTTLLLCRYAMPPEGCQHPWVSTFKQIDLR